MNSSRFGFPYYKVIAGVIALIAMIIAYSVWTISDSFRMALKAGERQAVGYTRAFSEHAESAFSNSDRLIVDLIEDLHEEGYFKGLIPFRKLQRVLKGHVEGYHHIVAMLLVDRNGKIVADSSLDGTPSFNVADRDYFSRHRDNPGIGLVVSPPFKSRVTGEWRFSISRPLFDDRGEFAGVVAVLFNAEYFRSFYRSISIGKEGRVALVHTDSQVLVMEPFSEEKLKLNYANSVLFRKMLPKSRSGTFILEKGIVVDGPARIISYRTLEHFPVVAIVSLSRDEILTPWRSTAIKQVLSTVVLCFAVMLLTALHLRQLRRIEETTVKLEEQQEELRSEERHRRQIEAQLLQSQKMESVGHLAGGIAHDFNNLLTPIIGYAELLKKNCRCGADADAWIGGILQSAERSKVLTLQLLGFARKQHMEMIAVDINRVVDEFNTIIRRTIRGTIEVRINLANEPIAVRADRGQIEQVLLNLAVNAQDAIAGHGVITVATESMKLDEGDERLPAELPAGCYASIKVSDTGCGMDETVRAHIFEPFFTTKEEGHGTGLGLAMAYGIVMQHQGGIRLESRPGEGSSFEILLPVIDEIPSETLAAAPTVIIPGGTNSKILVVEDNEMVRDMIVHLLSVAGYRVVSTADPNEALSLLCRDGIEFDLLLSDVIMPGLNGPELYERTRLLKPDLKVLFISGYTNDPAFNEIQRSSDVDFLPKPFSVDELVAKVGALLSQTSFSG